MIITLVFSWAKSVVQQLTLVKHWPGSHPMWATGVCTEPSVQRMIREIVKGQAAIHPQDIVLVLIGLLWEMPNNLAFVHLCPPPFTWEVFFKLGTLFGLLPANPLQKTQAESKGWLPVVFQNFIPFHRGILIQKPQTSDCSSITYPNMATSRFTRRMLVESM